MKKSNLLTIKNTLCKLKGYFNSEISGRYRLNNRYSFPAIELLLASFGNAKNYILVMQNYGEFC